MKGLFQCPPRAMPWAKSFCPFRACGENLRNFNKVYRAEKRNRLRWQMKAASLADEGFL